MPTLIIFSGLPGSGKTTLSRKLAGHLSAVHLRIDTIEQGLRDLCGMEVEGEGYRLAYKIATDNLLAGLDVIADSCNTLELTRREWVGVAILSGVEFINVEVRCSDAAEHRQRVESRASDIPNLKLPTWERVQNREYEDWSRERLIIETAGRSERDCLDSLLAALNLPISE